MAPLMDTSSTLLLIPGLLSDDRVWAGLRARIGGARPVVAADIRRDATIPGMARRLLDEVEGPLIAVGHSLGGRVAMEMARQAPERLKGLVLANTGHHPRRPGEEAKREEMIRLGHRSMEGLAGVWLPPMVAPHRRDDDALVRSLTEMVLGFDAATHERQIRALIDRPDAAAHLPSVACPVLLVAARQDLWSPVAQHEEIAALLRNAELAVIEEAGHFAPVERPEEVAGLIADWLSRQYGDPA